MKKHPVELPPLEPGVAYLLVLLRAALRKECPPPLPQGLSWERVCHVARAHRVENMAFGAAKELVQRQAPEVARRWEELCTQNQVQTLIQQAEGARVLEALNRAGIPVILLKGSVLRRVYPRPDWRQMCDLDLFVGEKNLPAAAGILASLGFRAIEDKNDHHQSYDKPPYLHVELHTRLVHRRDRQLDFFSNPWSEAQPAEGVPGAYILRPNAFYLHMLTHMFLHYGAQDCTIRAVLDVALFRSVWGSQLDEGVLRQEFKRLHLAWLAGAVEQLAESWFGPEAPQPVPPGAEEVQWNICYPCLYGTYGSSQALIKAQSGGSKLAFIGRRVFPPLWQLERAYPLLRRCPVLLPFCWLHRLAKGLLGQRGKIHRELGSFRPPKL